MRGLWVAIFMGAGGGVLIALLGAAIWAHAQPPPTDPLDALNAARAAVGAPPVVRHPRLDEAAQRYANEMARRGCFSHTDCGSTLAERLRAVGYFGTGAETLGLNYQSPVEVITGYLGSPSHKAILLGSQWTAVGIGFAIGPDGQTYYADEFGLAASLPDPEPCP